MNGGLNFYGRGDGIPLVMRPTGHSLALKLRNTRFRLLIVEPSLFHNEMYRTRMPTYKN